MTKLTGTPIPGFRLDRHGRVVRIPKDASAARRQRPGGSKKIKVARRAVSR